LERILPHGWLGLVADPLTPAESSQRLIGELGPGGDELFMDANQVAFAARVQLQNLLAVGRGLFLAQ
jgi:hypothetical protein